MQVETSLPIEVWSDIACPWCAIGKRHLEQALTGFEHPVSVRWRSFQLDPHAPAVQDGDYVARLAAKYRTDPAQAQRMIDTMTDRAAAEGLTFRFDRIRPGNTFDAHRLLHLAADRGLQDATKERFLTAYLGEGAAIGDHTVLRTLAREGGLDEDEVTEVLRGDTYADDVRADVSQARAFGIGGVPFFVIDRRYAIEGAQPAEVVLGALQRAWSERSPLQIVGATGAVAAGHDGRDGHDHGAACADGSCAV